MSCWPARMLPPQSLRAEPIFSLALNLTRIVVVMFFTTFSPWGYVERLRGRGGRSRALWRQLALLRDPYATPTYSMRYLRDLPQACQATHSRGLSCSPFRYQKTLFHTPERQEWHFKQTFVTSETLYINPNVQKRYFDSDIGISSFYVIKINSGTSSSQPVSKMYTEILCTFPYYFLNLGLRPYACWDCRFESLWSYGRPSLVECRVLSGLYVGLITRPEESYQTWCVLSVIAKTP